MMRNTSWFVVSEAGKQPHPDFRIAREDPVNFFEQIYDIVRTVPAGQVISYGQVACLAGNPHMARQVGWALHNCPDDVPWHRVIRKDGTLPPMSPEATARQRILLEREGITFDERGRIPHRYFEADETSPF